MLEERVRHRLHALQAEHRHPPHRAAAGSSRAPSDIDDYVERLRHGARRARRPLPRSAHRRDALLPRTRRRSTSSSSAGAPRAPRSARRATRRFRVWVAGCATGEEAYSLAILLDELTARRGERPVKIFATDVHRGSLEHASARRLRRGRGARNVSPERLERYFIRRGERLPGRRRTCGSMVVFAHHNVIKDAPFTRVDLVSCRNLLIYLQPPAQQKVLCLFHFALNRGGVAVPRAEREPRARSSTTSRPSTSTGASTASTATSRIAGRRAPAAGARPCARPALPIRRAAAARATRSRSCSGPTTRSSTSSCRPSLLVNERGELVHAFGGASRFLQVRDGRQGLDVLEMVDAELRMRAHRRRCSAR